LTTPTLSYMGIALVESKRRHPLGEQCDESLPSKRAIGSWQQLTLPIIPRKE
jgi:hypothetical protein